LVVERPDGIWSRPDRLADTHSSLELSKISQARIIHYEGSYRIWETATRPTRFLGGSSARGEKHPFQSRIPVVRGGGSRWELDGAGPLHRKYAVHCGIAFEKRELARCPPEPYRSWEQARRRVNLRRRASDFTWNRGNSRRPRKTRDRQDIIGPWRREVWYTASEWGIPRTMVPDKTLRSARHSSGLSAMRQSSRGIRPHVSRSIKLPIPRTEIVLIEN
jgi:hypothetical protein